MKKQPAYNLKHYLSAIFMIVSLLWLTVSLPDVASSLQKIAQQKKKSNHTPLSCTNEEEAPNPLTNSTEEKTPSAPVVLNEYLHTTENIEHPSCTNAEHTTSHIAEPYTAYHGELVGPPPKA